MITIVGYILLWILRIIGIILCVLLGIIGIVLFVPFRYTAQGEFYETIKVHVKFSWLFSLINGTFNYGDSISKVCIRLLLFPIYPKKVKREKSTKRKKNPPKNEKGDGKKEQEIDDNRQIQMEVIKETQQFKDIHDVKEHHESEDVIETQEAQEMQETQEAQEAQEVQDTKNVICTENIKEVSETNEVKIAKKQKKPKKQKKEKGIPREQNSTIMKIKHLWEIIHLQENEGVFKHITKYVIKIIQWILPKKLSVDLEIGLDDPALTGYIAGAASVIFVLTKRKVHIIPNFTEQIIQGQFKIKGRLFLFQVIYYIIRVIIDKRVRRLIKELRT